MVAGGVAANKGIKNILVNLSNENKKWGFFIDKINILVRASFYCIWHLPQQLKL